jgi:anti-anti-sigma factor
MPAEIDIANAGKVRETLWRALNGRVRILVIDMSGTTFCDVSGLHVLERAYQRAQAGGAQLRLVVTAPIVRRLLTVYGLHRMIAIYPSVAAARPDLYGTPRATVSAVPARANRDGPAS